jgi:WD40 repeat protein
MINRSQFGIWKKGFEIRPLVGHSDDVTSVVVAADGKRALSASWDGQLILWDLGRRRILQHILTPFRGVRALSLLPDYKQIVIAGENGNLHVCNLQTGETLLTLRGHQGTVWRVIVTPDRHHLISTSEDRTVKVWDLQNCMVVATFTGESPMRSCAYGPEKHTIIAGEQGGRIHFLR